MGEDVGVGSTHALPPAKLAGFVQLILLFDNHFQSSGGIVFYSTQLTLEAEAPHRLAWILHDELPLRCERAN